MAFTISGAIKLSHKMAESLNDVEIYKRVVNDGCMVQIKHLSLTKMHHKYNRNGITQYQVHCSDPKNTYSELFDDLDDAIEKFLGFKNLLYKD